MRRTGSTRYYASEESWQRHTVVCTAACARTYPGRLFAWCGHWTQVFAAAAGTFQESSGFAPGSKFPFGRQTPACNGGSMHAMQCSGYGCGAEDVADGAESVVRCSVPAMQLVPLCSFIKAVAGGSAILPRGRGGEEARRGAGAYVEMILIWATRTAGSVDECQCTYVRVQGFSIMHRPRMMAQPIRTPYLSSSGPDLPAIDRNSRSRKAKCASRV
jgi:hypothetical protein